MNLLSALEPRRRTSKPPHSKDVSVSRSGASLTIASSESSVFRLTPSSLHDDFELESRERATNIVNLTQKTLRGLPEEENAFESNEHNNHDLIIGETIAMGGFGWITQVKAPTLPRSGKYVMKTLIPLSYAASDAKLISAAHQLAKERYFFSQLSHSNIIAMQAMSRGGLPVIRRTQRLDSYFFIVEYLPMQLNQQIQEWRQQQPKQQKHFWSYKKKMHPQVFLEQITCAVQIASALDYLHQQRVILRDVKPANVGMTEQRQVKLFDFGLAVQLPKDADLDDLQPSLGGSRVGTVRYAATEVLRKQPYNVKADVFSFALSLWEMIILDQRPPEGGCGVYGGRPTLPAWADDFQNERPHMSEVLLFLQDLQRQLQSERVAR